MMKRLLAALAMLCIAGAAHANVSVGPRLVSEPLRWRTHSTTYVNTDGTAKDVDSTISNRLGTQVFVLDTTSAFSTRNVWRPSLYAITAADTNKVFCTFNVYDSGSSATAADSCYIAVQASYDGTAWFTLATLIGGTAGSITSRLDQTQATGTFYGRLNKLGASGGTPSWAWNYKYRSLTAETNDQCGLERYPMLRWIVGFPDAVMYSVKAQVIFQSAESQDL